MKLRFVAAAVLAAAQPVAMADEPPPRQENRAAETPPLTVLTLWDGDVIPRHDQIDWDGLDVRQSPRFAYRGLRYFAHRCLHRFQAEHWDLDDWKHEIDWLLKKRFNLFMLRTGIDDLFQRAFPDDAAYPPTDGIDPDAKPRSYDDRTAFWPIRYRGELRKAVLQYARDRGLLHPEDTGTITHWYSHTPSSFYRSRPDFPVIRDQKTGYALATHAIWDIESQVTWDAYWQLTQTLPLAPTGKRDAAALAKCLLDLE